MLLEKILWSNQLLILFGDLEKWEWLHLSNFFIQYLWSIAFWVKWLQRFICHHSKAPSESQPGVLWTLLLEWGRERKTLFTSENLRAKSLLTELTSVPFQPKGFLQFQSQLIKTLALRPFFLFYQRICFSPSGMVSPQVKK